MTQKIGDRELALRKQREDAYKAADMPRRGIADLARQLPPTSGKKPIKRKKKSNGPKHKD